MTRAVVLKVARRGRRADAFVRVGRSILIVTMRIIVKGVWDGDQRDSKTGERRRVSFFGSEYDVWVLASGGVTVASTVAGRCR